MVASLIWREIGGLFKVPSFYIMALMTIVLRALEQQSFSSVIYHLFVYQAIAFLLWQDVNTKEIGWLFLLPVKRKTVFVAKYLAGLLFAVLFTLAYFDFSTGGSMSKALLSLAIRFGLYIPLYSLIFGVMRLALYVGKPR